MGRQSKRHITHGSRQAEVGRFRLLLLYAFVVEWLFFIACVVGPVLVVATPLVAIVFGPPYTMSGVTEGKGWIWVVIAFVLVGPLYCLRRSVRRRLAEARFKLEQIGLPESPEDTDTSHTT